jgi:hypothetical protein
MWCDWVPWFAAATGPAVPPHDDNDYEAEVIGLWQWGPKLHEEEHYSLQHYSLQILLVFFYDTTWVSVVRCRRITD